MPWNRCCEWLNWYFSQMAQNYLWVLGQYHFESSIYIALGQFHFQSSIFIENEWMNDMILLNIRHFLTWSFSSDAIKNFFRCGPKKKLVFISELCTPYFKTQFLNQKVQSPTVYVKREYVQWLYSSKHALNNGKKYGIFLKSAPPCIR